MTKQRKYTAYLATLVMAAVLNFANGLTGAEFVGLMKVALTVFVLGNAAEHYTNRQG